MKKILLLLLILPFWTSTFAQVDINRIDSLKDDNRKKIQEIDELVLYKTLLDYNGYRIGDETSIDEWLTILYFDLKGELKKSKTIYFSVGDEGYYQYYYYKGVVIKAYYFAYSAMNNGYSISRSLDIDGNMIEVDFIRRDDDREGQLIEHIKQTGGYDLAIPLINGEEYDKIANIEDLETDVKERFDIENLYKPENTTPVKLKKPERGDTTSITRNRVVLYEKPSICSLAIGMLDIRPDIVITEVKDIWYKIRWELDGKITEGYIHKDFLAPVEREIK